MPCFNTLVRAYERQLLLDALTATSGNKSHAAKRLGMARSTFENRLAKSRIVIESPPGRPPAEKSDPPLAFAIRRVAPSLPGVVDWDALWTLSDVQAALDDPLLLMLVPDAIVARTLTDAIRQAALHPDTRRSTGPVTARLTLSPLDTRMVRTLANGKGDLACAT